MKGASSRRNNRIILEVNRQTPVQNADQTSPGTHSYRYNKTKFIDSEADQTSDQPSPTHHQQIQPGPNAQSYQRIKFVDCAGLRPGKRRRLAEKRAPKDTRLAVSRPVKNALAIHEDAWRLILNFAAPSFLLNMRMVSKFFNVMLKDPSIWRKARACHLDPSTPDCPFYLTEPQYADLILAQGCQSSTCLHRDTRKVYWLFGVRLCESCLRQYTDTDSHSDELSPQSLFADLFEDAEAKVQYGKSLLDLIPSARMSSGKYIGYRFFNPMTMKWSQMTTHGCIVMYQKSTYAKIAAEFKVIQEESWPAEKILEWAKQRYENAIQRCAATATLENHFDSRVYTRNPTPLLSSKEDRADFFTSRARNLHPPMTYQHLQNMAAFHNAIVTPNAPSERSWQILLPKILPYREDARRIEEYKRTCRPDLRPVNRATQTQDAQLFKRLFEHRNGTSHIRISWSLEQRFILELAQDVFKQLNGSVADEDLVLLTLYRVYDRYQTLEHKPPGFNYDGTESEYKLGLDDVKMILEEVMHPAIDRNTLRGVRVFDKFQCPGCKRHHAARRWTLQGCFEHIYQSHALLAGEGLHFHRLLKHVARFHVPYSNGTVMALTAPSNYYRNGFPFPWVLLGWPKTLPILPDHAEVSTRTIWDPDSNEPYGEAPQITGKSAFADRHALLPMNSAAVNFEGNFIHAAKQLSTTTLNADCVAKIALKYSLDLYGTVCDKILPIDAFIDALQATKAIQPLVAYRAKCGVCANQPDVSKHHRQANKVVEVRTVLLRHWRLRHEVSSLDWTTVFIAFPSDAELLQAIQTQDDQLRKDQARSIQRETISLQKSARKIPDLKAKALQEKRLASEVLESLFVRNDSPEGPRGISVRDLVLPSHD